MEVFKSSGDDDDDGGGGDGDSLRESNAMLISTITTALRHFTTYPLMHVPSTMGQYWKHYEMGGGIPAVKEGSISEQGRAEQHLVHSHNGASFILHSPQQFVPTCNRYTLPLNSNYKGPWQPHLLIEK